jgi:hypothetical protein
LLPVAAGSRPALLDPAARGIRRDLDDLDLTKLHNLHSLDFGVVIKLLNAVEDVLRRWDARAIDLAQTLVGDEAVGSRVRFGGRFYTRNSPSPDEAIQMSGDPATDPHLWTRIGERKSTCR